jgi:hypothetical protein
MRMLQALFIVFPLACTSTTATTGGSSTSSSSGAVAEDAGLADAGPIRCDGGPCESTSLAATFGASSVTLDVAYLGLEPTDAGMFFYIEAYRGASPGCPQMNSPTPDQTLILANVPAVAGSTFTYGDGVRASLLDFNGDLFNSVVPARAAALEVVLRDVETSPASSALLVADVMITFADGGTLAGTLAATHCDSLDF